jgi:rubrerythrin
MAEVKLDSILQMEHLHDDDRLNTVLKKGIHKVLGPPGTQQHDTPLWPTEHFGLQHCGAFNNATPDQQELVIAQSSQSLLEEALFIEQSGLAFGAKMALLSETIEERMLYGLFMGDETAHYQQVRQFLPNFGIDCRPGVFHQLLTRLIEEGDRETLVFTIQVVLEGWGLTHYRQLADGCLDPEFGASLRAIVKDEARHHGSGVILARQRGLPPQSRAFVIEILNEFLTMVQLGPQSVVTALENHTGSLTRDQKIKTFEELDTIGHSQQRLNLLRNLMEQDGFQDIVDTLNSYGLFKAKSPGECV